MEWVKYYEIFIKSKQTNALTLLLPTIITLIKETMNYSDEVWRWMHQKYGMSRIIRNWIQFLTIHLPCCFQRCPIESKKQWMVVIKYEGGCIKTMEWVESQK